MPRRQRATDWLPTGRGIPGGTEPIESDAVEGAFPREKLLKMDARFTDRVTRALERGKESRGAANATMTKK
jgi:hypothetical protein